MIDQQLPKGWDEKRVRDLIAELDARSEDEWVVADEASVANEGQQTLIAVPITLLPAIRKLLAESKSA